MSLNDSKKPSFEEAMKKGEEMPSKNVVVGFTGRANANGFLVPASVKIANPGKVIPVTFDFSENKIGVAKNFKKVANTIRADVELDKLSFPKMHHIFRLGFQCDEANEPSEIAIFQVALLPKYKDAFWI